jgi:hypothetical protein
MPVFYGKGEDSEGIGQLKGLILHQFAQEPQACWSEISIKPRSVFDTGPKAEFLRPRKAPQGRWIDMQTFGFANNADLVSLLLLLYSSILFQVTVIQFRLPCRLPCMDCHSRPEG